MRFELLDHTADVAIAAEADSRDNLFEAIGEGLASAQCDAIPPSGDRFPIRVEAESIEALLFDYLDELIYQRDVKSVLPVDISVTIARHGSGFILDGSARGVPLDEISAREVKAVTYSDMSIERDDSLWRGHVVVDV